MHNSHSRIASYVSTVIGIAICTGCSPKYEARVYDAPKVESQFVRQPPAPSQAPFANRPGANRPGSMGKSAIPISERRILGAAIPDGPVVYFLKFTDTIQRLEGVQSDFRSVVERFGIDLQKKQLLFDLPAGWSVRWRENDIAKAELNVDVGSEKPVLFTITDLAKPEDLPGWEKYLLSNINRWREQLELSPIDYATLEQQHPKIEREGAPLPAYIFDKSGADASFANQPSVAPPSNNPSTVTPPAEPIAPPEPTAPTAAPSASEPPLKLIYDKPDSWELQPNRAFRLASFRLASESGGGEIVVSMAKDAPLQNAKMWSEQVLQSDDATKIDELANKVLADAEDINAGSRSGKLVSIRASDEPTAPVLVVASIPTGENDVCLFVKMKSDLKTSEIEKSNLIRFINSIRWE